MGNVGSDQFAAFTIIGDAVNVAARIQGVARSGTIVVTQAVRDAIPDLADRHALTRAEPPALKGKQLQALYCLAAG